MRSNRLCHEIYTRSIVAPSASSQKASLAVETVPSCEIVLWTPQVAPGFEVDFSLKGGNQQRLEVVVLSPNFGISIAQEKNSIVQNLYPSPDSALKNNNYLNPIDDKGDGL